MLVAKRNGQEEPFDLDKVISGIRMAVKNRPVSDVAVTSLAEDVEETMRADPRRPISSAEIGREVLERLRELDDIAYLRFASVYKDFQELDDFEKELGVLLKRSPPKGAG